MSNSTTDDVNSFEEIVAHDVISIATIAIWMYFIQYSMAVKQSRSRFLNTRQNRSVKELAQLHIKKIFVMNIVFAIALYASSSYLVRLLTRGMDRRMNLIVIGSSRIFASIIFLVLSLEVPKWLGQYYSSHNRKHWKETINQISSCKSLKEIRFNFSWALWQKMASMFFFNLFFSCRYREYSVLYGFLIGIPLGIVLICGTHFARHKYKQYKFVISIVVCAIFLLGYALCTSFGILYITSVWLTDDPNKDIIAISTFISALFLAIMLHGIMFYTTKRKKAQKVSFRFKSGVFRQGESVVIKYFKGSDSKKKGAEEKHSVNDIKGLDEIDDNDAEGRQGGGVIVSYFKSTDSDKKENEEEIEVAEEKYSDDDDIKGLNEIDNDDDIEVLNEIDDELMAKSQNKTSTDSVFLEQSAEVVSPLENADKKSLPEDSRDNIDGGGDADSLPSYYTLVKRAMFRSWPLACRCLRASSRVDESNSRNLIKKTEEPLEVLNMTLTITERALWSISSMLFLFLTIVNIGSTRQQEITRAHLPPAWKILYPPDYNNGSMCAWDKPEPDADIRTFETLQNVYDANYTVVHCGACADCSSYNDLALQWTTRAVLSPLSKACATKSLLGGTKEDVQKCMQDTIGFSSPCASCWTYDVLNTKSHCAWIFFQSIFINAVADFQVNMDDVTSATCDEAMSGPKFVPCSGATRRRMDIESLIARPVSQQCTIIDQVWSEVFDHP